MLAKAAMQSSWTSLTVGLVIGAVLLGLLLRSEILIGVVVVLPFLIGVWLARSYQLYVTREAIKSYVTQRQVSGPVMR